MLPVAESTVGVTKVLINGGVLSSLTVTEVDVDRPTPFVAEHVNVIPAVSAVSVVDVQPDEEAIPDSGSVTFQLTLTLLLYQPLLPNVPAICGLIIGGVVSPPPPPGARTLNATEAVDPT
jgi:hypothetical protein